MGDLTIGLCNNFWPTISIFIFEFLIQFTLVDFTTIIIVIMHGDPFLYC